MREIKFRAWHLGRMTYDHSFNVNIGGQIYYLQTGGEWEQDIDKDVVLLQYTGLKDKNGREIYEGDILKFLDEWGDEQISAVVWGDDYPAFTLDPKQDTDYNALQHAVIVCTCEVIGNIYENPELLNQQKGDN